LEELSPKMKSKSKIIKAVSNKSIVSTKNTLAYFGFGTGPKTFYKSSPLGLYNKKLLIIAPGILPVPPSGWGAVETLIYESLPTYYEDGFEVWILNSYGYREWRAASREIFDVVLCHYDIFAKRARSYFPNTPIINVCQYGFVGYPEKWHKSYHKVLKGLSLLDSICVMNNHQAEVIKSYLPNVDVFISSNGTSFKPIVGRNAEGSYLCVGKVEPRKSQFELYNNFKNSKQSIVFVGKIVDQRVQDLINKDPSVSEVFIGEKTRIELAQDFHKYKALILLSQGEADALVLYEAQMAGLPIFVTEEGIGAQNLSLPWINIITNRSTPDEIEYIYKKINSSPLEISNFAAEKYSWKIKNVPLILKINQMIYSRIKK
jgi:hypothetical protein